MTKNDLILWERRAIGLAAHLTANYIDWTFRAVRIELVSEEINEVEKSRRIANLLSDIEFNQEIKEPDPPAGALTLTHEMMEKIRVVPQAPLPWQRLEDPDETKLSVLWCVKARHERQVVTMFTNDRSPVWLRRYRKGESDERNHTTTHNQTTIQRNNHDDPIDRAGGSESTINKKSA